MEALPDAQPLGSCADVCPGGGLAPVPALESGPERVCLLDGARCVLSPAKERTPFTPMWTIPVHTDTSMAISAIGVQDFDVHGRSLIVRLVARENPDGAHVAIGAASLDVEPGTNSTPLSVDLPYIPSHAAHFIQVWYEDIPRVNRAVLFGVWVESDGVKFFTSATLGFGDGAVVAPFMDVDWLDQ